MKREIADRFFDLLKEHIDTDNGQIIVLKMVQEMNEKKADSLIDEIEGMMQFADYLTESEAREITSKFVNFDGTRGAHWRDADAMFDAVKANGMYYELKDHYNRWAWYATMNMVWSDEWGILRNYIKGEDEVKVIAELTAARLMDKDKNFSVRYYFDID